MTKNILYLSALCLLGVGLLNETSFANEVCLNKAEVKHMAALLPDTIPPTDVMDVVKLAINSLNNFNIDAVANLYTPNAVVADDEPPYSWNGPTAGVQWVNAVEQVCKQNHLTRLKGSIEAVNVYQQTADNTYIVVPVNFKGNIAGQGTFETEGAFTFVLRMINGKWMIKSQVWMPRKGM